MGGIGKTRWQAASPLLDELLEADEAKRTERLAQIRRDHPALAEDVEKLLSQQAAVETADFLEGSALPPPDTAALAGQGVGSYVLERPIGQGGMSSVWLASRSDGRFEGRVAIKFLNLALLARGGAERFAREGSMLARLSHPNIARLLDAGVAAGTVAHGQPYLVLEYIDGTPIDAYCDAHTLGIDARLRLFLDVLAAVAHAHNNLILHRDLKPSNILVTRYGQVKLLDFGIGKLLAEQDIAASATELTQLAGRAFTPEYAAPEQLKGEDVTTATDVYALGVLLYELLAGRHPTALPTHTPVDRQRAVIENEPARASDAAARSDAAVARDRGTAGPKLARLLRGDLDNIVAKALKKSPAERYPNAAALAEDLRRFLAHEPVWARADSFGYRARKFVRRNRLAVAASVATVLALTAGVVGTTWQALEAQRQRTEALQQRDRAQALLGRNEAIVEFVDMMFTEALPAGQASAIQQMLERSEALVDRAFAGQPTQQAELLRVLASYYTVLTLPKKQEVLIARARELAGNSADPSLKAQLACSHAASLSLLGQRDQALRLLSEWTVAPNIEPGVAASCLQTRAVMAQEVRDSKAALHYAEAALKALRASANPSEKFEAELLGDIGFAQYLAGHNVEADRHYQRAFDRLRALGRQESVNARRLMLDWGLVKYGLGDFKRGVEIYDEAIRAAQRVQGNEPIPPGILANRAAGLEYLGRFDEALAGYEQTYAAAERAGIDGTKAYALAGSAGVYEAMRDTTNAQRSLNRAAAFLKGLPEAHPARTRHAMVQAAVEAARGDPGAAHLRYTRLVDLLSSRGASRTLISALRGRADASLALGNSAGALGDAERALELARKLQGDVVSFNLTGQAGLTLGRILRASGETDRARETLQTAANHLVNTVGPEHPDTRLVQSLLAEN